MGCGPELVTLGGTIKTPACISWCMAGGAQRDIEVETHLCREVSSEFWYFLKNERAFIVSEEFTNANTGDTSAIWFENPSDSGESAVFSSVSVSASSRSYARIHDGFSTAPSGGSDANLQNILLDSAGGAPDVGVVTAKTGPSYTADETHERELVPGGAGSAAVGGRVEAPVLVLEPDREIVVEVEKLASGGDDVSVTAQWFEIEKVYSESNTDPPTGEVIR